MAACMSRDRTTMLNMLQLAHAVMGQETDGISNWARRSICFSSILVYPFGDAAGSALTLGVGSMGGEAEVYIDLEATTTV